MNLIVLKCYIRSSVNEMELKYFVRKAFYDSIPCIFEIYNDVMAYGAQTITFKSCWDTSSLRL